MRYRKITAAGDYSFGQGPLEFFINTPAAVAQAIRTRLLLMTNEWFLNAQEGTPYAEQILGRGTLAVYDQAIKERALGTQGVLSIDQYVSLLSPNRALSVYMALTTVYGGMTIQIGPEDPYPHRPGRLDVDFILDQSTLA